MASTPLPPLNAVTAAAGVQPVRIPILNVKQGSVVKIINDTQFDINMTRPSGGNDRIASGEVNIFLLNNNDVNLYLTLILNPQEANVPNTFVQFILYDPDTPPTGTYPLFLARFGNPTVSSIGIGGIDNWIIAQNPNGQLYFQNTTTGAIYYLGGNATLSLFSFGGILGSTGGNTTTQSYIYFSTIDNTLKLGTPQPAGGFNPTGIDFETNDGAGNTNRPLSLGTAAVPGLLAIDNFGHIISTNNNHPTISTGLDVVSASISGTDVRGNLSFTTGGTGTPGGNIVAAITFATAYAVTPQIFITPLYPTTGQVGGLSIAVDFPGTTGFQLANFNTLAANVTYTFGYFVIG